MKIIFTDLDGTLLDKKYSFKNAMPALKKIKKKKIPLILCSSKTKKEMVLWQKKIKIRQPFIVENGGAIFIPVNYFKKIPKNFKPKKIKSFKVIELGVKRTVLIQAVKELKKKLELKAFSEMTPKEFSIDSQLPLKQARLALQREYSEGFKLLDLKKESFIRKFFKRKKLNLFKGTRYFSVSKNNDKGKAVRILIKLFELNFKEKIQSIAFGDSENDFKMLKAVDKGFLVEHIKGGYASNAFLKAKGVASKGFNKKVIELLKN